MKLNSHKQFLLLNNNCFEHIDWHSLTNQRRILLASITRYKAHFVAKYVQHLRIWAEVYRHWGVDQVYLITHDNRYNIIAVDTVSGGLPVLGDVQGSLAKALAEHCGIHNHSADQLSRYWNYQALINNAQVEQIYWQPMDNLLKNFVHHSKNIGLAKLIQPLEKFHLTPFFLRTDPDFMRQVLYYNLHPNTELKNYLFAQTR